MKVLRYSLFGLVPMLGAAVYVKARIDGDFGALAAFCNATRNGERWSRTEARARAAGYELLPAGSSAKGAKDTLVVLESMGFRAGCRVTVQDGVVAAARLGQMPTR